MPPFAVNGRLHPVGVPHVVRRVETQIAAPPPEPELSVTRNLAAFGESDHRPPGHLPLFRPFQLHPERDRPLPQIKVPVCPVSKRASRLRGHPHRLSLASRRVRKPAGLCRLRIAARERRLGRTVERRMEHQFRRMLRQRRALRLQIFQRRRPRAVVRETPVAELHDVVAERKPLRRRWGRGELRQDPAPAGQRTRTLVVVVGPHVGIVPLQIHVQLGTVGAIPVRKVRAWFAEQEIAVPWMPAHDEPPEAALHRNARVDLKPVVARHQHKPLQRSRARRRRDREQAPPARIRDPSLPRGDFGAHFLPRDAGKFRHPLLRVRAKSPIAGSRQQADQKRPLHDSAPIGT